MTSRTVGSVSGGSWKNAHYGPNFAVKWMKVCFDNLYFITLDVREHHIAPEALI